jgi:hypothetical protein
MGSLFQRRPCDLFWPIFPLGGPFCKAYFEERHPLSFDFCLAFLDGVASCFLAMFGCMCCWQVFNDLELSFC